MRAKYYRIFKCVLLGLVSDLMEGRMLSMLNEDRLVVAVALLITVSLADNIHTSNGLLHSQCKWMLNLTTIGQTGRWTLPVTYIPADHTTTICSLHLRGCRRCRINISIKLPEEPFCSHDNEEVQPQYDHRFPLCSLRCRWVLVEEPFYPAVKKRYNTSTITYSSLTSDTIIHFCLLQPSIQHVHLNYTVLEKLKIIQETNHSSLHIYSPNFPLGYATDSEIFSYSILARSKASQIRVLFDDWNLASHSKLVFYSDMNRSKRLSVHYGSNFPPVIDSEGPSLFFTFQTGNFAESSHHTRRGFKATIIFINDPKAITTKTTECGEEFFSVAGGNISFHASPWQHANSFDCIWIVHRDKEFENVYLRLVLVQLHDCMPEPCTLVVKDGIISDGGLVLHLNSSLTNEQATHYSFSSRTGFYIRFTGSINKNNFLSLIFFSASNSSSGFCSRSWEFFCNGTGQCIDSHLVCDQTEHCVDGQDEHRDYCRAEPLPSLIPVAQADFHVCHSWEFLCSNGRQCVPNSSLCDTWLDCNDGSDEYLCTSPAAAAAGYKAIPTTLPIPKVHCGQGLWRCHTLDKCVFDWQVCDGFPNCPDGSDESLCSSRGDDSLGLKPPWNVLLPLSLITLVLFLGCIAYVCVRLRHKPSGIMGHNRISYITRGYINPPSTDPQSTLVNNVNGDRPATPPSYDENVPRRQRIQFVNQGFMGDATSMQINSSQSSPTKCYQNRPEITTTVDINNTNESVDGKSTTGCDRGRPAAASEETCAAGGSSETIQAQSAGAFPYKNKNTFRDIGNMSLENQEVYTSLCETVDSACSHSPMRSPQRERQPLLDVNALQSIDTDVTLTGEGELLGPVTGATKTSDWVVEV